MTKKQTDKKYKLYLCGTDILHLEGDPKGVAFYSSLTDLKSAKKCLEQCGILSIEINYNDFKGVKDDQKTD